MISITLSAWQLITVYNSDHYRGCQVWLLCTKLATFGTSWEQKLNLATFWLLLKSDAAPNNGPLFLPVVRVHCFLVRQNAKYMNTYPVFKIYVCSCPKLNKIPLARVFA